MRELGLADEQILDGTAALVFDMNGESLKTENPNLSLHIGLQTLNEYSLEMLNKPLDEIVMNKKDQEKELNQSNQLLRSRQAPKGFHERRSSQMDQSNMNPSLNQSKTLHKSSA